MNNNNENPRTAPRFLFCADCKSPIEIELAYYKNYEALKVFLKKHKNHITMIGTKKQIQENSYFRTFKKDMTQN